MNYKCNICRKDAGENAFGFFKMTKEFPPKTDDFSGVVICKKCIKTDINLRVVLVRPF
jgi:hypothetical protein